MMLRGAADLSNFKTFNVRVLISQGRKRLRCFARFVPFTKFKKRGKQPAIDKNLGKHKFTK